jgi:hypothetical protein
VSVRLAGNMCRICCQLQLVNAASRISHWTTRVWNGDLFVWSGESSVRREFERGKGTLTFSGKQNRDAGGFLKDAGVMRRDFADWGVIRAGLKGT